MSDKHCVTLENRKHLKIDGVIDVESTNDMLVKLTTKLGKLIISGSNMNVEKIDVGSGEFSLTGDIKKMEYKSGGEKGKFSSMFK